MGYADTQKVSEMELEKCADGGATFARRMNLMSVSNEAGMLLSM